MTKKPNIYESDGNGFQLEQVGIRLVKERSLYSETKIDSPEAAVQLVADALLDYDREVFGLINLQVDNRPINLNIISMGTLNSSLVHPRETLKSTILSNASNVLLFHNHPSGKMKPSKEDISITDQLVQAFNMMGIKVLDHVIVGNATNYYSFLEQCTLPLPRSSYATSLDQLDLRKQKVAEAESVVAKLKETEHPQKRKRSKAKPKEPEL